MEKEQEKAKKEKKSKKTLKIQDNKKKIQTIAAIVGVTVAVIWITFTIIVDCIPSVGRKVCFNFLGHSYGCIPVVKQKNREFESGTKVDLKREFYIENESDVKFYIKENREYIETPNIVFVGNKEIDLYIEYKNKKTKQKKRIKMVDTTPPVIKQTSIPRIPQNEKIKVEDYVDIFDNSGENKSTLLNNYTLSTEQCGEKEIVITAEDLSGNVSTYNFKYNVLIYPTEFIFSYESEIELGKTSKIIDVMFIPKETTATKLKYYNYDDSILSIAEDGLITAVGLGTTEVYVESENGITNSMTITVYKNANFNAYCNTGELSNGKCYSTITTPASLTYECYSEDYSYREEYGKCLFSGSNIRTKCPAGYSHSAIFKRCYPIQEAYQSYYCPQGELNGSTCIVTKTYKAEKEYYCDSQEVLKNEKCYKK